MSIHSNIFQNREEYNFDEGALNNLGAIAFRSDEYEGINNVNDCNK